MKRNTMKNSMTRMIAALAIALVFVAATTASAATATYDFDNGQVTAGQGLVGQDGWGDVQGLGDDSYVRSDMASVGMTGNAASNFDVQDPILGRVNDANFSYTIAPTDTGLRLEFLGRMEYDTGRSVNPLATFALGYDANDSGDLDSLGEVAFQFGYSDDAFTIREAAYGTEHKDYSSANLGSSTAGEVWRMVLDVDFSANGGNGGGSMSVAQIWDGTTLNVNAPLITLTNLQNTALGLTTFNHDPELWDAISIRMVGGAGGAIDDMVIQTIPEPATMGLLAAGAIGLLRRRKRK